MTEVQKERKRQINREYMARWRKAHPELAKQREITSRAKRRKTRLEELRTYHREYSRMYRIKKREHLLELRRINYQKNQERELLRAKVYRDKEENKEKRRAYRKEWYKRHPDAHRRYREANLEKVLERQRAARRRIRQQVLDGYGNACACCSETTPEFLALDHVNNDGAAHRRRVNRSVYRVYQEVIERGFPPDFQLLCHNCNASKQYYGQCPHQRMRGGS